MSVKIRGPSPSAPHLILGLDIKEIGNQPLLLPLCFFNVCILLFDVKRTPASTPVQNALCSGVSEGQTATAVN